MTNPTSNYSFQMPTATDLVTDLPADFEVFGQAVDTRLKALQPGTTLGDLAYSSATANTNTRLAIGTTGQILTVAGGVPTWATPAGGGGKVLQVVFASYSTRVDSSTSTFADSGLTATITPTSNTSKVLVIFSQGGIVKVTNDAWLGLRLLRGATVVQSVTHIAGKTGTTTQNNIGSISNTYLDSPATTSATTYKTQFNSGNNNASVSVQNDDATVSTSTITLLEIGA